MNFERFDMLNRYERILAVPREEWHRRWDRVRDVMRELDLGAIFVYGNARAGIGFWLTGYNRQEITIVPFEGDIQEVLRKKPSYLNETAFCPVDGGASPVPSVNRVTAPAWVSLRAQIGIKRIGLINAIDMTVGNCEEIKQNLPGATFVNVDNEVGVLQGYKSEFELELVRESMKMHDRIHAAVPAILRVGRTMKEVSDDIRSLVLQNGSSGEDMCLMILTHDLDGRSNEESAVVPGKKFTRSDIVEVLLETNGPGGYYTVVMREYALGTPSDEFLARYEIAKSANLLAGKLMYEGNTLRKIADQVNDFIQSTGYTTDNCCYLHSMGYDLGEMPILRDATNPFDSEKPSEVLPLHSGMVSLAHPHVGFRTSQAYNRHDMMRIVETWQVTRRGGIRLSKTPTDIIYL